MKKWINSGVQTVIALLFSGIAVAAPPSSDNDQIAQLLDQLGTRALLDQAPAVLSAAIEAQAKFSQASGQSSPSTPQTTNWRRDLEAQLKLQALIPVVTRYLHEHYNADTFRQAQQRLQEPLAKRARYFDLAMTQPGAENSLREFLLLHKTEHGGGVTEDANSDARRKVLREIDTASAASLSMATLQSAIAARVKQAAGQGSIDAVLLKDETAERQRFLAPLTVDYLLYDYRYLRDDELQEYRDLLRDDSVQALLEMSRQALLFAIVGELTPPPSPSQ